MTKINISLCALSFAASFVFVFLKAFQQRSVAFDNYAWVLPTSLAMSATEVFVVANVASTGWNLPLVLAIGFGGGIGCLIAMVAHRRFTKRRG